MSSDPPPPPPPPPVIVIVIVIVIVTVTVIPKQTLDGIWIYFCVLLMLVLVFLNLTGNTGSHKLRWLEPVMVRMSMLSLLALFMSCSWQ